MIKQYDETFFSRLRSNLQEQLYNVFKMATPRDKILLLTKFKYGDEITFKELSEKMHFSTARSVYSSYIDIVKSGVIA